MDSSTLMLLQEPQEWRPAHLKAAKVQLTRAVPVTSLVEPHFIPRDGDEGFENLAEVLCRLTRADKTGLAAGMSEMSLEGMESHVKLARNGLVDLVDPPEAGDMEDRAAALRRVLRGASRAINGGEDLHAQTGTAFQFHVPPLKVRAQIQVDGAVLKGNSSVFDRTDAPLAVFSVIPGGSDRLKMARFEVPQALFQAVMTYTQNPYLERYEGYVITLEGTVLRISRAAMSGAYMERLCQGQSLSEPLELCRSEAFELLDPGGRREFVRAAMGLVCQRFGVNEAAALC